MAVRIQLRRDVASAWTENDPVLLAGEIGVETDTLKIKVGDGITAWTSLDYAVALPADVSAYVQAEVASVIDSAPGTLDTLNEIAAALGDDPNFAATISSQIALKADDSALSAHTGATTSVHGITDTSALETQTGAQTKADAAQSAAQSYTDSVAGALTTDDVPEGTNQYFTDERAQDAAAGLITGATHTNVTTTYDDVAGTLAFSVPDAYNSTDFATDLAASDTDDVSEGLTNLYFTNQRALDATASAYDTAGAAAAAQTAAQAYADTAAATAAAAIVDTAPATLDTLNELAAALGDDPNFATTVSNQIGTKADASALTTHESDTTSVHGIADTSALVVTTDSRLSDTRTPTDNTVSTAKIVDGAVTSAKIANGTVVNDDISGSAAIAQSKISGLTTALSGKVGSDGSITQIVEVTQAAYDALTPSATTLYVIVG